MGEKLGVDIESYKVNGQVKKDALNSLITEALVMKDSQLTEEIRSRFIASIPDKTSSYVDLRKSIKKRE